MAPSRDCGQGRSQGESEGSSAPSPMGTVRPAAQVDGSSRVRWQWVDATRAENARSLFFRHRDKNYSFTDCTSFVVMRELKLKEALTTDRHFRQIGFRMLP